VGEQGIRSAVGHRWVRVAASIVAILLCQALAVSAAAAAGKPPLRVVLIGDSYAAGNGAGNYWGPSGCYRSHQNWAERYVSTLRSKFSVIFTNRACSGSVIDDVRSRRFMEVRHLRALVPSGTDPDSPEARQIAEAICQSPYRDDERDEVSNIAGLGFGQIAFDCKRTMDPQWNAIDHSTDLVLLSIAGNDLHFADIVKQCFALGFRDPHDCKDRIDDASAHVNGVRTETASLLEELKGRLRPGAKIVLNSYPYLEKNPDLTLGREIFGIGTRYPVGKEIRALGDRGEQAQREAVSTVNGAGGARVVYIDQIKPLFAGHEPDGRVTERNPDRWLHEFDTTTLNEWYHYNNLGHQAIAGLLAGQGSFGVGSSATSAGGGAVDIAFLIDTTGSMGPSIGSAKAAASSLISEVQARTSSARFAVIDYRDFPERTGASYDYPAFLDQDFTADGGLADAAIQGLELGYGGDGPETMYSALHMAFGLSWRAGAKKMTIILADAPPLSPEPISGLTREQIIDEALAIDPVEVHAVDVGAAADSELTEITEQTNGGVHSGSPSTAAEEIGNAIDESLDRPFAWAGGPYVGPIGTEFEFDGSGSYGIESDIVKWEWDFDNDGTIDLTSDTPETAYSYPGTYEGLVSLKVTDASDRVGLGTAVVSVSQDGDGIPSEEDNCPAAANIGQEDEDEDGVGDVCDPTSGFPTADLSGVFEELEPALKPAAAGDHPGPGGGGPAAAVADLELGKARFNHDRTNLNLRVRCLSVDAPCQGRITIKIGGFAKLRGPYSVAASKRKTLRFAISPTLEQRLGVGHRLSLIVEATSDDDVKAQRRYRLRV
jgi:GDSL-like Lipase/Acylhydrolase family/PKD domain/von Willebrand factor type A domain/Thrombospondin type 3 repeat